MTTIEIQHDIAVPAERVWEALADFGGIAKFHPHLSSACLLDGSDNGGLGAERRCDFTDGNHILERVTDWQAGRSLDIEIYAGSMPLQRAVAHIEVAPDGAGHSRVTMRMDYALKWGVAGRVMDAVMMRGMFRKRLQQLLQGLDQHLSSPRTSSKRAA